MATSEFVNAYDEMFLHFSKRMKTELDFFKHVICNKQNITC